MTEKEIIAYIENIPRFGTKHTLAEVRDALHLLGDPDRAYPSIHVAGTNGKGSVCAFLASVLKTSGKKTGLFTSPHLISMRERFRINGEMVSEARFLQLFESVRAADETLFEKTGTHLSYFEFLYLMACVYFQEEAVDLAVIETGLGGRLDATNTIEQPLLCVITSVSFDHMQYLGDDLASIAREKAGIIKAGVPIVCLGENEEVLSEISARAEETGSPVYAVPADAIRWEMGAAGGIDFCLSARYDELTVAGAYHLPFLAPYQADNASLAVLAAHVLRARTGWAKLTEEHIRQGLAKTVWEARMEEILPDVYLDGAHNVDAIAKLCDAIRSASWDEAPCILFAGSKDKDCAAMAKLLVGEIRPKTVIVTEFFGGRAMPSDQLASFFQAAGCGEVIAIPEVRDAFCLALSKKEDGKLMVCGSLYLAGMIKEMLNDQL